MDHPKLNFLHESYPHHFNYHQNFPVSSHVTIRLIFNILISFFVILVRFMYEVLLSRPCYGILYGLAMESRNQIMIIMIINLKILIFIIFLLYYFIFIISLLFFISFSSFYLFYFDFTINYLLI